MKKLSIEQLDELRIGCAILGSGGGGDPSSFYLMARHEMEKHGPITLLSPTDLKTEDLILPVGFIGAPLVEIEKIQHGGEFNTLLKLIEKRLKKKITGLMPYEIGGAVGLTPFLVAARLNIPVIDADLMGRAFPDFRQTTCHLHDLPLTPAFIVDCLGNAVIIDSKDNDTLDRIGSQTNIAMGSSAAIGLRPLSGAEVKEYAILKSISTALSIGKMHKESQEQHIDPVKSIIKSCKGILLGSGKVRDIVLKGFFNGHVNIQGEDSKIELFFQNEYLVAKANGTIISTTPDILMLFEQDTGMPVPVEQLQFGLEVDLLALPAKKVWTTPKGLRFAGPRYFGFDLNYKAACKLKEESQFAARAAQHD